MANEAKNTSVYGNYQNIQGYEFKVLLGLMGIIFHFWGGGGGGLRYSTNTLLHSRKFSGLPVEEVLLTLIL